MIKPLAAAIVAVAFTVMLLPAGTPAEAQSPEIGKCGSTFEHWNVTGPAATIITMTGIAQELMAAQDCVRTNQIRGACNHYRQIVQVIESKKVDIPFPEDLRGAMQRNSCGA